MGVDPGTNMLGYGIINAAGSDLTVVTLGVLKLVKYENHYQRLKKIFDKILSLIDTYHPDHFAVEAPFFGKNVQSMLKLGRAQGVCIAAALNREVPVYEYSPRKVKQSITGRGAASKEQVSGMLHHQLKFDNETFSLDATDALAVALCHYHNGMLLNVAAKEHYSGWDAFIRSNPGRIKQKDITEL